MQSSSSSAFSTSPETTDDAMHDTYSPPIELPAAGTFLSMSSMQRALTQTFDQSDLDEEVSIDDQIIISTRRRDIPKLTCLLKQPFNRSYTSDGNSAIHIAVENKSIHVFSLLATAGMQLDIVNAEGSTALMMAVELDLIEITEVLLKHYVAFKGAALLQDTVEISFFVIATCNQSPAMIDLLLKYQGNINQKQTDGFTALTMATQENDEEMIKFLLSRGADNFIAVKVDQTFVDDNLDEIVKHPSYQSLTDEHDHMNFYVLPPVLLAQNGNPNILKLLCMVNIAQPTAEPSCQSKGDKRKHASNLNPFQQAIDAVLKQFFAPPPAARAPVVLSRTRRLGGNMASAASSSASSQRGLFGTSALHQQSMSGQTFAANQSLNALHRFEMADMQHLTAAASSSIQHYSPAGAVYEGDAVAAKTEKRAKFS